MGRHFERPTLHNCQAEYEKTLYGNKTRARYCSCLDLIVAFFGRNRNPADVFRHNIPELKDHIRATRPDVKSDATIFFYMQAGNAFYNWMDLMEYVPPNYNPFRLHRSKAERYRWHTKETKKANL